MVGVRLKVDPTAGLAARPWPDEVLAGNIGVVLTLLSVKLFGVAMGLTLVNVVNGVAVDIVEALGKMLADAIGFGT
jgi:hypothetical protein